MKEISINSNNSGNKQYLDYLIDLRFQGVKRLFALSFEDNTVGTGHTVYFVPKVEIKEQNVMINDTNFYNQRVQNDTRASENIQHLAPDQGDHSTTGCLLDYPYFKENYKLIAIDLSKQQVVNSDPKTLEQIIFTRSLERAGNRVMFFIIKEVKLF